MNTAFGPLLNPSSPSSWVSDIYSNCPRKRPLSFINWILVSERLPYLWLDAQDAQDAGAPHFPTLFESFELVHPEALKPRRCCGQWPMATSQAPRPRSRCCGRCSGPQISSCCCTVQLQGAQCWATGGGSSDGFGGKTKD